MIFTLNIHFTTEEELKDFIAGIHSPPPITEITETAAPTTKQPKKENDRRGKHMQVLHQQAKEYHVQHPDVPYRECFKLINKKD
jgi:hypothetical protein